MANGEAVVGRGIACAEARAAEAGLDDCSCFHKVGYCAYPVELQAYGHGCRIDGEGEIIVAGALAAEDSCRLLYAVEHTAGAAAHKALGGINAVIAELGHIVDPELGILLFGLCLQLCHQLLAMLVEIMYRIGIGGVERKGYHGFHLIEIDMDHAVIVGDPAGLELGIILGTLIGLIPALCGLVGLPDGAEAGGLGGHYVHTVAEIHRQVPDAGAYELKHAVVDEAGLEGCADERDRNVVRTDTLLGLARHIDHDHLGHIVVPGVVEKLLCKLRAALADRHGAESAVAGVAVRTKYHASALCHLLTGIGMNDAHIGRHIDTAVFLGCGQSEYMVILVDGSADCAEAVVAVGQRVGHRELLHSGGASLLYDADIGYIV